MRKGVLVVAGAGLLVILLGGGAWWYVSVPHTAEAQFAVGEKLDKEVRAEAVSKTGPEIGVKVEAAGEQYRRVGTRFGKSAKAAEGMEKIAKLDEEVGKDSKKAMGVLDELEKGYPDEEHAGYALTEEARLLRAEAEALKGKGGEAEANAKFREALAKLEDFRKRFEKSAKGEEALMEIGRIWQDGIEVPPIKTIETFEQVLKDYPHGVSEAEATYRLGREYEKIKEYEKAVALYAQVIEQYPKSKWAADATYARGQLLADKMDKHDEAAKDFQKMAQDYPDDPRAGAAGSQAKSEEGKAAEQEGKKYGQSRYGGNLPFDTSSDKPLPPAEMFAKFTAQKLDAEKYELDVDFAPGEHRITVKGTLKLVNKGEEKKELLLMLGPALKVESFTVDGAKVETTHGAETLKVVLGTPLKKDAEAVLGFAYTGQYADAGALKKMMGGEMVKGIKPATAPASGPASAPAGDLDTVPASAPAKGETLRVDPQMALGEYGYGLSGASWYPITIIGDVFDAHVVIHVPEKMEAVTNGAAVKREKSEKAGAEGVFEYETKAPVFGLYFAYGPYVVQEKQVGAIHFYTYMKPANAGKSDGYVEVANRILSFYAEKYAGFPYEKMAVIEAPLPSFLGGVGPASLMFLQEEMVAHPEVPENLLAHELAHQWFGNLIPINITDPGYSQWMSEGFATYCDALYTEHKDGAQAFAVHIQQYQQLYFQFAMMAPKGSGAIKDTTPGSGMYRPVVYEKGALVLHMLRRVMGDEKFFALMKKFVETYKNKPTVTDDFRKMASDMQGEDLSWFFSEWYDRAVFAHWKVAVVEKASAGGTESTVTITQPDELVKMPANVTLIGAKEEKQVVKDVMLDKKENVVVAHTPFVPVKVVVDEENWVLKRLGSDNIWTAEKATAVK